MRRILTMLMFMAFATAPLVMAHDPAGTPKNYCEVGSAEWSVHDYAPVASGVLIYGNEDGNLGGDCDNSGLGFEPGTPCVGFEDPADPLTFFVGLCDSQLDLPAADWDGHNEFAFGGAWLLVNSGDGTYNAAGSGTIYCFGAEGHHSEFGPVSVVDAVLGAGATFTVAADSVDTVGSVDPSQASGCGDFESDNSVDCVGTCTWTEITFPAGLDGAYVVYVQGTMGHVDGNGGEPSVGTASSCHVNSGDCSKGACRVNTGECRGNCTVNTGTCAKGSSCAVNAGRC
jgi:hypothetical protein